MARSAPPAAQSLTNSPVTGFLLACFLIVHFLYNFIVPAHKYPMRTEQVLTIAPSRAPQETLRDRHESRAECEPASSQMS